MKLSRLDHPVGTKILVEFKAIDDGRNPESVEIEILGWSTKGDRVKVSELPRLKFIHWTRVEIFNAQYVIIDTVEQPLVSPVDVAHELIKQFTKLLSSLDR